MPRTDQDYRCEVFSSLYGCLMLTLTCIYRCTLGNVEKKPPQHYRCDSNHIWPINKCNDDYMVGGGEHMQPIRERLFMTGLWLEILSGIFPSQAW